MTKKARMKKAVRRVLMLKPVLLAVAAVLVTAKDLLSFSALTDFHVWSKYSGQT